VFGKSTPNFRSDCAPYFTKRYHYMTNRAGEMPDGNALAYTGIYYLMKQRFQSLDDVDVLQFTTMVRYSQTDIGQLNRGIYKQNDQQRHDDYIPIMGAARFLSPSIAMEIWKHGGFQLYYNNTGSKRIKDLWDSWFNRLNGVKAHFKMCVGYDLDFIDKIRWALDIWSTSRKTWNRTSGRILDFTKVEIYRHHGKKYWLCEWAVRKFERSVREKYPHMMGSVFHVFFDRGTIETTEYIHPFARWMRDKL